MPHDATLELPLDNWEGPFPPDLQAAALAGLESGQVLFLPRLGFVTTAAEQGFLAPAALDESRKNISLDPATGTLHGTSLTGAERERLAAMLERFARRATALLHGLLPRYAPMLERARTSFRPAEIAGRRAGPRQDDTRLHVDAFPTRPMRGRRILRVFANIAPDGAAREWRVGEPFADFAQAFLPRVRAGLPGQGWLMQRLGLTKGRRAPYDFLMLGLHDAGKLDDGYQARAPHTALSFPAGTVWLCYTDSVLHAAMAGHCALEQTFHLPVAAMARPEQAPLRVLERLAGRALA
jgi:hypothetical protein